MQNRELKTTTNNDEAIFEGNVFTVGMTEPYIA
jgi:hypothetical protein